MCSLSWVRVFCGILSVQGALIAFTNQRHIHDHERARASKGQPDLGDMFFLGFSKKKHIPKVWPALAGPGHPGPARAGLGQPRLARDPKIQNPKIIFVDEILSKMDGIGSESTKIGIYRLYLDRKKWFGWFGMVLGA